MTASSTAIRQRLRHRRRTLEGVVVEGVDGRRVEDAQERAADLHRE